MKAVVYRQIQEMPEIAELPEPPCPSDGVVVAVRATGLCRSDWHAWMGHEPVPLPHVPGHEFAGVIDQVGAGIDGWSVGDRVTAPFVYACGTCAQCRAGDHQICDRQEQPGFSRWGSFAERVVVTHAQTNLVRLPDALGFAEAASLGCRFATAYRAVVVQGRLAAGETLLVSGCGGLGLAAIQIGVSLRARVVGVDPFPAARAAAEQLGARTASTAAEARALVAGAHVALDAYGSAESAEAAYASLRKRGRHIQVGLLAGAAAFPRFGPRASHLRGARDPRQSRHGRPRVPGHACPNRGWRPRSGKEYRRTHRPERPALRLRRDVGGAGSRGLLGRRALTRQLTAGLATADNSARSSSLNSRSAACMFSSR